MKHKYIPAILAFLLFSVSSNQTFAQLSPSGTPPGFKFGPVSRLQAHIMPAINVDSMLQEDAVNGQNKSVPWRFGYVHLVYFKPDNSGLWTTLPNGDRIWQLDVKTPGSYTINLAFCNFHLPAGAKLFVYSRDHSQVFGGFTSDNNTPDKLFGTDLLNGDEAIVEYYEPAAVKGQGSFILNIVTQGYREIHNYLKNLGDAGACINNVDCYQYQPYWTQKRGVVCLLVNNSAFCSGSLINDNRNDGTPYVLTANHCDTANGNWVFRFNWEAPGCPDPPSDPGSQSVFGGGTTVAHCDTSDFNLVRMNSAPPCNFLVFYNGWSRSTVPATSVTCIHHPQGDIKKCTRADNPVSATSYDAGNGPAEVWQIGLWTDGVTEPGSSGSPLLDQNKRIIGQLYGGPSDCGVPDVDRHDFYGRFSVSWDTGGTPAQRLKEWLDPDNTNAMTNDGYYPCLPVDSLDAALISIDAPVGSTCGDSIYPVINFQNLGANAIRSLTVSYHVDANPDAVYTWSGYLMYLDSIRASLPAIPVTGGAHHFYVNISQPNGSIDQNPGNDAANSVFTVTFVTPVNTPFSEGFEEGSFPPTGWTFTTPPSGTTWKSDTVGGYSLSHTSAAVNEFSPSSSTTGETPQLISPPINLANLGAVVMQFDVAYARYNATNSDSLAVLASVNCGGTWTPVYGKGGTTLATAPDDNAGAFVPTSTQWRTETIRVNNLIGQSSIIFSFEVISGYGQIVYVDNINISGISGIRQITGGLSLKTFPNPFNDAFNIQISLDEAQNINANLYSIDGRLVSQVINSEKMETGEHQLVVNTHALSSGLYFLRVNGEVIKLEKY